MMRNHVDQRGRFGRSGSISRRNWIGLGLRIVTVMVASCLYASQLPAVPSGTAGIVDLDSRTRLVSASELTPSGALPLYPENHTLDGADNVVGGPANATFEEPSQVVGAVANHDLQAPPTEQVAVPNGDFETGAFSDWSVAGSPTIASDAIRGNWARFGTASDAITTQTVALPADAQYLAFEIGYLSTTYYSGLHVDLLSGPDFATVTTIASDRCYKCGVWQTRRFDIRSFAGQTLKIRFRTMNSPAGLDDVRVEDPFAGFSVEGGFSRETEADGNVYAKMGQGATLTSPAFTVAPDADDTQIRVRGASKNVDQYRIWMAVGPDFSSWTQLAVGSVGDFWNTVNLNLGAQRGLEIKLRVQGVLNTIGADDIGVQQIPVPGWETPDGSASRLQEDGNSYVETSSRLVSSPYAVASTADHLTLRVRSSGSLSYYVELLRGSDFSQVVTLDYRTVGQQWEDLTFGIAQYTGETIRLQVRRYSGQPLQVDDAGLLREVLPAWQFLPNGHNGLTVGEDADGTYVSGGAGTTALRSSVVAGVDVGASPDVRYHSITYSLGQGGSNGILYVDWLDEESQTSTELFWTSTGTGVRQQYFTINSSLPNPGRLQIRLVGDVRAYAISDNLARTHLSEPYSRRVGQGIDTSTGALSYQETDLTVPGVFPINFTRFYRAHSDRRTSLGGHWSHTYDAYLAFGPSNEVAVVYGSRREEFFTRNADGTYRAFDARVQSTLVKGSDDVYTLTTKDRLAYAFTSAGKLTSITDPNGNTQSLTYDAQGRLSQIAGPGGVAVDLAYDGTGKLASVTGPGPATFSYAYDSNNNLTSVTNPETETRTFTYDRQRLIKVIDERGNQVLKNTYDGSHRVISQEDAAGASMILDHEEPGRGATVVVDPEGEVSRFYFNKNMRTTHVVDPQGRVVSYFFDSDGNLNRFLDPDGNSWAMAWDASGNLTSTSDPLGNPINFTYNAKRLPTSITDARGNTTTFTYDSNGNLASRTDPLGHTWSYTYDSSGNKLTETDPLSNTTTFTYDAQGNKLTETDPLGNSITYTYDSAGRLRSETDAEGNRTRYFYDLAGRLIVIEGPDLAVNSFLYGPAGHLLRVDDPLGNATTWTYDARGLVTSKTDAAGNTSTYTYDSNHRMTSMTDPLGNTTTYTYHPDSNVASITDPEGNTTSYEYDSAGRLSREVDPLNRVTSYAYDEAGRLTQQVAPNGGSITYTYDPVGNLVSQTDALGNAVTYSHDAANRLTRTTDPLGNETVNSYDAAGRLTAATDPEGGLTAYDYDPASRLAAITDPSGAETTYGHDGAGQVTSVTDATDRTTTYGYDPAGRVTAITDPAGNTSSSDYDLAGQLVSTTSAAGRTATYSYDPRGLLLSETDGLNNTTAYTYDAAGQRKTVTDPRGHVTEFTHDGAGLLTGITDALGGTVSFAYDAAGQRTGLTDPRGQTWTYSYDLLGNLATETDPLQRTWNYTYDASGQRIKRLDPKGQEVDYAYDASGRLTGITHPDGETTYAYDGAGRRVSMNDDHGITSWSYDAAGRFDEVTSPEGAITYDYDPAGRRTALGLPGERHVEYGYDAAGRLESATVPRGNSVPDTSLPETDVGDPLGGTVTFNYDADGNRTKIARPNGIDTANSYDAAGRLKSVVHTDTTTAVRDEFTYTLDAAGNRTAVGGTRGDETYMLDKLNRIKTITYAGGTVVEYDYDAAGNRVSESVDGVTTAYSYDDASQLTAVGSKTFAYDANGNVTSAGNNTFSWDWDNRLTGASVDGTTATHAYDGDGVRVASEVDGTGRAELSDRESGLPVIVDDGTHSYLHADGPIASVDSSGEVAYMHADALGSIRGRSDALGLNVGTTDYEVFGAPRAASGVQGLYGFTGEPQDATGLVHLRARTLDPSVGRFLSPDTVRPGAPGTAGYHLYTYVANNPSTWVDPTGHSAEAAAVGPLSMGEAAAALTAQVRYLAILFAQIAAGALTFSGITGGMIVVSIVLSLAVLCGSVPSCRAWISGLAVTAAGAAGGAILDAAYWTPEQLRGAISSFPALPAVKNPMVRTEEQPNPQDLRKATPDEVEALGGAHEVKKETYGGDIDKYDIYRDKKSGRFWSGPKHPKPGDEFQPI